MSFPKPPKGYTGRKIEELLKAAQGSYTGEEAMYFEKCKGKVSERSGIKTAVFGTKGLVKSGMSGIVGLARDFVTLADREEEVTKQNDELKDTVEKLKKELEARAEIKK